MFEIPYYKIKKKEKTCQIGIHVYACDRDKVDVRLAEQNLSLTDFIRSCMAAYADGLFEIK